MQVQKTKPKSKFLKLRFGIKQIPSNWMIKNLGKLSTLYVPMRDKPKQFGGTIPWLRIEDLDGKYVRESKSNQKVTQETIKEMKLRVYPVGTVLCSCSATLGVCAITTSELITNQTFIGIHPSTELDDEFLFYYLSTQANNLRKISSGTTIPYISRKKFEDLPILFPPKNEQQKIASILSNVDSLISQYDKVIESTKIVKKGLMQKLLIKGIGHTKFKKIKWYFGKEIEIPEGWEIKKLHELCRIERGKFTHRPRDDPAFYNGKYPFIQTGDVEKSDGYITNHFQTLNDRGLSVSKLFPANIIVITIAANIGTTAITTYPICFPDSLIGITPKKMDIKFLELFLTTRKNYLNIVATVSAQKNINLETLKPLLIPVPTLKEQKIISSFVHDFENKLIELKKTLEFLQTLKRGLVQKLLTGQIRVRN